MAHFHKGSRKTKMIEEVITKKGVRCGNGRHPIPVGTKAITFVFVDRPDSVRVRFCSQNCREESEAARFEESTGLP